MFMPSTMPCITNSTRILNMDNPLKHDARHGAVSSHTHDWEWRNSIIRPNHLPNSVQMVHMHQSGSEDTQHAAPCSRMI